MRTIRISDDVWEAMKKVGEFGETPDDVLRRVFKIEPSETNEVKSRPRYARRRMSAYVNSNFLIVEFEGGPRQQFPLPDSANKLAIRKVRDDAVQFAEDNEASLGQVNAVKKALTDAGYHLTK